MQKEESLTHILSECALATKIPVRVLHNRNGEPISKRYALRVLISDTWLYSAAPVISTTDFGDSGHPCSDASCKVTQSLDQTSIGNVSFNNPTKTTARIVICKK